MGDAPLGGERSPFRGERGVEDRVLFGVQEPGQVNPGAGDDLGEEGVRQRHGERRDNLEAVLVDVLQFAEARPDAQGVEDGLLPAVRRGERADRLTYSIEVERHGSSLIQ
jgi:hypothetical protein